LDEVTNLFHILACLDVPVVELLAVYSATVFAAGALHKDALATAGKFEQGAFGARRHDSVLVAKATGILCGVAIQACLAIIILLLLSVYQAAEWTWVEAALGFVNLLGFFGGLGAVLLL